MRSHTVSPQPNLDAKHTRYPPEHRYFWYGGDFYIADYYFDGEVMDYQINAILNGKVGNQGGLISLSMIINCATLCALHQMTAKWMFEMQMGRDVPDIDPDVGITLQRGAQVRLVSDILTRIIYRKHLARRGNWIIPPTKSNADRFARELKTKFSPPGHRLDTIFTNLASLLAQLSSLTKTGDQTLS